MGDKVPVFDWTVGDFAKDTKHRVLSVTGAEAVEQIVIKAQATIRGVFLLYAGDPDNPDEPRHVYGSDVDNVRRADLDEDVRLAELERAVREAIIYDPYVTGVSDITFSRDGEAMNISATIDHIFSEEPITVTTGG